MRFHLSSLNRFFKEKYTTLIGFGASLMSKNRAKEEGVPDKEGLEPEQEVSPPGQRQLVGFWKGLLSVICIVGAGYVFYSSFAHPFFTLRSRPLFWAFMIVVVFLTYSIRKEKSPKQKPSILDLIFLLAGVGICLWISVNAGAYLKAAGLHTTFDVLIGIILIITTLEATRRTMGIAVPILCVIFILYAIAGPYFGPLAHPAVSFGRAITYLTETTSGCFGIPLGVIYDYVFLFVLFGVILQRTGGGKFFSDLAFALTGSSAGGPAKVAVTSSTFFGMLSGSSVANTTTTGSITIPLMKKAGFRGEFAGGAEASASTMGQIMPPIMGAAAFIMAEFLKKPYVEICIAAFIPALLSFAAVFLQAHFCAKKEGIGGTETAGESRFHLLWDVFHWGGHHLISVVVLIGLLLLRFTPQLAAVAATITEIVVSSIPKHSRLSPRGMVDVIVEGSIKTCGIAAVCAAVGFIVGVIVQTGLGITFTGMVIDLTQGILILVLVLTAVASLILGMGVPTTAQYIIIAALICPVMVRLGVLPIAAHLFALYWGTRADITPPVCVAAYAASGISGDNPMKTGTNAFMLGIAGYIIPFFFIFHSGLLVEGSPFDILLAVIVAIVAIICLAGGVQGYLFTHTTPLERVLLIAISVMTCFPFGMLTLAILPLLGIVLTSQWWHRRSLAPYTGRRG